MINDLAKKLELLKNEQAKINNSYEEQIKKVQDQIDEANKKTISIGLPMYCDIINALSTGIPAKDLANKLIEIGKTQCKDIMINTDPDELKGTPTWEPKKSSIDLDVQKKSFNKDEAAKNLAAWGFDDNVIKDIINFSDFIEKNLK